MKQANNFCVVEIFFDILTITPANILNDKCSYIYINLNISKLKKYGEYERYDIVLCSLLGVM